MAADSAPTKLPAPGSPSTVYVLDISGFIFRSYHALPPLSNSKGEPTHAVSGVVSMLERLLERQKPAWLLVAMDQKDGSFRNQLYDLYKANRPLPPPDLSSQIERIREIVDAWGMHVMSRPGYEADDLIATAVRHARAAGHDVVIVSGDKDLLQLVGEGVVMYDTTYERVFGVPETIAKMGVPPDKVRDLLALVGDTSDNVPGVPSVGPKTALKLLEEFGDIEGVLANAASVKAKGTREKLLAHMNDARLSYQLVSLKDCEDLTFDFEKCRYVGPDATRLRKLFHELELTRALAKVAPVESAPIEADYRVIRTEPALRKICADVRQLGRMALHVVVDEDTVRKDTPAGIAVSTTEGHAAYIPLAGDLLAGERVDTDKTLALLKPLLENSLIPKRVAYARTAALALSNFGIELRGVAFDARVAGFLLDPDRASQSLDVLVQAELGAELPTEDAVLGKGKEKKRFRDLTLDEAAAFANQRVDYLMRLAGVLEERMEHGGFPVIYKELELPLVEVLLTLERTGIRVDTAQLASMSKLVTEELKGLDARVTALAGHPVNVGSPKQLETVLFDELGLPVVKKTKTGRSTDHAVLEELAEQHELPAVILEHRALAKLQGTYLEALPREVDVVTGRIHTRFDQTGAATGRISSKDPNLQNIPIKTELGRKIREAFVPEPGYLMLSADYSQIELRVLAHLSHDPELVDAYTKGDDVHVRTATALFGVPAEAVTREQRGQAKTVNFAVIYGQTEFALARNLKIERAEAKRYIAAFFERYAGVARFMKTIVAEAQATGYVTTLYGRRRGIADIRSANHNLRSGAERIARNTPIQGTAADILKRAMIDVHRAMYARELKSRMLLTVHDELLFEVPPEEKDVMATLVHTHMQGAASLDVPLEIGMGWGNSWGAAH